MRRRGKLIYLMCVVAFVVGATYAVGGASTFRRLRARLRAFMEPPTPAQVQQATAAAEEQAVIDSLTRTDTSLRREARPASPRMILTIFAFALGGTVVLFVGSARWASKRD
jgi:hypothetical protein